MTVNAVRRPRRRPTDSAGSPSSGPVLLAPVETLAIGEFEQTVFDCPNCRRPLALGARRCPGCRTRLLNGVTLKKASGFLAAGMAIGLLVGGGTGVAIALSAAHPAAAADAAGRPLPDPAVGPVASVSPSVAPSIAPTAVPTSTPDAIPPVTRSALVQVMATNDRLRTAAETLRSELGSSAFDASEVAQVLRLVSADSVFGSQIAGRVTEWPGTAEAGTALAGFYASVHETADGGLVASVRNEAAYRSAARTMVRTIDGLAGIDAALRAVATSAGVTLPSDS